MKLKVASTLYRTASFERAEGDSGKLRLIVSTDTPYKRFDFDELREYFEVLDHGPGGVDEERLVSPGLPILFNHDSDKNLANARKFQNDGHQIILEEDGFIWAAGDWAENKRKDIESGALPHFSVGYEVLDNGVEIGKKEGLPIIRFKWKIYEASAAPVPADVKSSSNRNRELERETPPKEIEIEPKINLDATRKNEKTDSQGNIISQKRENIMTPEEQAATDEKARKQRERDEADATRERSEKIQEGIRAAREREKEINDIAARATVPADRQVEFDRAIEKAIEKGVTDEKAVSDFQSYVFKNFWGKAKALEIPSGQGNGDLKPTNGKHSLSLGRRFVESEGFKRSIVKRGQGERVAAVDSDFAILGIRGKVAMAQRAGFTSTDLSAVNVQIQQGVIGLGMQRLTIMDLLADGNIGGGALIYPRENTFGTVDGVAVPAGSAGEAGMPKAGMVGERGIKPNWEPDLTTETTTVKKVAITTKVPDEFMADFPAAQSYIDNRLPFMVDTKTEEQILYGDGLGNNLKGIFTNSGVQTRAIVTSDDRTIADSLKKGLTDIEVGSYFEPDAYAFHPYDWETASLLKDSQGRYLMGGPFYIPYGYGVFMELYTFWGKPVVKTTAVQYRRPIAGCFKLGAQYFMREGMHLDMTNANEDDFRRNLIMLRAEHRLLLATYRPSCFLEFTGFPART